MKFSKNLLELWNNFEILSKIYRDSSEEEDEIDVVMPQHYAMDADGIYPITHMGSLKSSLKRNTNPPSHPHHHYPPMNNRSYEALYLTPHDRSDLHNHSKSIANFPIYESRGFQSQSPGDAYPMPHGDKGSLRSKSSVTINTIQRHPGGELLRKEFSRWFVHMFPKKIF